MLWLLRLVSPRHISGAHPPRTGLTVLGVATLVGVISINGSVMEAFRSTVDAIAGKTDLTVAGTQVGFDEGEAAFIGSSGGLIRVLAGLGTGTGGASPIFFPSGW